METNASCVANGAVLAYKKGAGKAHPSSYASQTKSKAEKKYSTCGIKALAVLFALRQFRAYWLSSLSFVLRTEDEALKSAFARKDNHGRLARWLKVFAEYDFESEFKKEESHKVAYFLSSLTTGETFDDGFDQSGLIMWYQHVILRLARWIWTMS